MEDGILTFEDGRTIRTDATDWRSQCPKGDVGRSSTCKDQYETSNQIWCPKKKSQTKTPVFQIEIDGKRYTALSVGRDFTSQGKETKVRKEKREGTTVPNYSPKFTLFDKTVSTNTRVFSKCLIVSPTFILVSTCAHSARAIHARQKGAREPGLLTHGNNNNSRSNTALNSF
jgi:hypothetical protein